MRNPLLFSIASKAMEWQVQESIPEEKLKSSEEGADAESGSGQRHGNHSPGTSSFRPKFLHALLAGDSRLSLASRFGSKNSLASGTDTALSAFGEI